jgi:hypothetical protein
VAFSDSEGFEPKKAIEEWKKAKPLLLQDTGISGLLRLLPEAPAPEQLTQYVAIQGKLKAQLNDPKIKKEAKAVKCITAICDDITKFLKWFKDCRNHVITRMKTVVEAVKTCQVVLETHRDDVEKVRDAKAMAMQVANLHKVEKGEMPNSARSALPDNVAVAWMQTYTTWGDSVTELITYLSAKKDPKAAEAIELTKKCKLNVERLEHVMGLLKPM